MREIALQELLEAGCHFGHQVRRWNPSMNKYIYGVRDNVHIFDLAKTKAGMMAGADFLKKIAAAGGTVLFVGTKRQASEMLRNAAQKAGMPYVDVRWMGGTLTNFEQISKRVKMMKDLKAQRQSGELKKYTKREQLLIDREIAKLEKFFGGVSEMTKLPEAMFVVDSHRESVAIREAVRTHVPVVAMVDTNGSKQGIDYLIPINDDAAKSIELTINYVTDAVVEGKTVQSQEFVVHSDEKSEEPKKKKTVTKKAKKTDK